MVCKHCHTQNADKNNFCENCGYQLKVLTKQQKTILLEILISYFIYIVVMFILKFIFKEPIQELFAGELGWRVFCYLIYLIFFMTPTYRSLMQLFVGDEYIIDKFPRVILIGVLLIIVLMTFGIITVALGIFG